AVWVQDAGAAAPPRRGRTEVRHDLLDLVTFETPQLDAPPRPRDVAEEDVAIRVVDRGVGALRACHEQWHVDGRPGEEAEQLERGQVGLVEVVEHHDAWPI